MSVPKSNEKGIMRVKTLRDSLSTSSIGSSTSTHLESTSKECDIPSVGFKDVTIREYAIGIGDNPSCSEGVPISLDWAYVESFKGLSIDLYEKCRRESRREQGQLRIPARIRLDILVEDWECSLSSVIRASRQTDAARMERSKTAIKSIKQLHREDKIKAAIKPFKIVFKKLRRNKQKVFSDLKNLETFSDSSSRKDEEDFITFF